ncbi:DUF2938 domain-containing protein [Cellvibrio sp. OA-2007]|uniref:DUF2938 domain-containing protein n=1 Tax=Cellvibrio sp. OA-2007 TaxID=529823 RepID=UPI000784D804|nr:DUF2938 domain-containing protein [Cellvibrio sp. OA-2007]
MSNSIELWIAVVAIGMGATVVMDLWAIVLRYGFNIPSLSYCLVGRWFCHMKDGIFYHSKIAAASSKSAECLVGWSAHYVIGIVYAAILVLPAHAKWLQSPSVIPAVVVGLATVVFPFFIMQPALGLGVAAGKAPKPGSARVKTLLTHTVFGIGLYAATLVYQLISNY